jgi:hypothetical protein
MVEMLVLHGNELVMWAAHKMTDGRKWPEFGKHDKAREAAASTPATAKLKQQSLKGSKRIEKLIIGWGGTIWIINVHPEGTGVGKSVGERTVGRAEIIKM